LTPRHGSPNGRTHTAQFHGSGELPALLEGGADRGGFSLGHGEHAGRMGRPTMAGKWYFGALVMVVFTIGLVDMITKAHVLIVQEPEP
jgi:hypothetical protein